MNKANKYLIKREKREHQGRMIRNAAIPIFLAGGLLVAGLVIVPLYFDAINPIAGVMDVELDMEANGEPMPAVVPGFDVIETPAPELTAAPTQAPSETPSQIGSDGEAAPVLKQGDKDERVRDIQSRLMELGYIDGDEPTDNYGPVTEAGIMRFQRVHYMNETGVADELTLSILFSQSAKVYLVEKGNSGSDVRLLQMQLHDLGYYEDYLNGYFGVATQRALMAFQTKNKLTASGIADMETQNVLYSSRAKPKIDPTPTPKPTRTPKPASSSSGSGSKTTSAPVISGSGISAFLEIAKAQQGKPYRLSEEGPDAFDCSGFVYYSLNNSGVKIGRMRAASYADVSSWPTIASKSDLATGDLIFFTNNTSSSSIGHVGIWLGNNKYIHASSSAGKVLISSWSDWATNNFRWGKRVF